MHHVAFSLIERWFAALSVSIWVLVFRTGYTFISVIRVCPSIQAAPQPLVTAVLWAKRLNSCMWTCSPPPPRMYHRLRVNDLTMMTEVAGNTGPPPQSVWIARGALLKTALRSIKIYKCNNESAPAAGRRSEDRLEGRVWRSAGLSVSEHNNTNNTGLTRGQKCKKHRHTHQYQYQQDESKATGWWPLTWGCGL